MPAHDYKCACGTIFEAFTWLQDIDKEESKHPKCPACTGRCTERQPALFARTPEKWKVEKGTI